MTKPIRSISTASYGTLPDGRAVELTSIQNHTGMKVEILNYGGIVKAINVPDRAGASANVVLGFDRLDRYVDASPYFGAIVGRFANRIAGGSFALDGFAHQLVLNERLTGSTPELPER
jgi:aldose 1-epimerase